MQKKTFLFLRVIITFLLVFALFKIVPYKKITFLYQKAFKFYLLLSFLSFFISFLLVICRWKILLKLLNTKISFFNLFLVSFCANFFNLFFPSFIGSDFFKVGSLTLQVGNLKKIGFSVILDRFLGSITLITLGSFGLFLKPFFIKKEVLLIFFLFSFFIVFLYFLLFVNSFRKFILKFLPNFYNFKEKIKDISLENEIYKKKYILKVLLISFFAYLTTILSFYFSALAFSFKGDFFDFLIIIPLVTIITSLPITIAGLGVRDFSSIYFFSLIGISHEVSLSISFFNFFCNIFLSILGGFLYVSLYYRCLQCNTPHKRN